MQEHEFADFKSLSNTRRVGETGISMDGNRINLFSKARVLLILN